MENNEGTADDENSGWFEVKKKHRTTAKVCIQKGTGKSFKKNQTFAPSYQAPTQNEGGNFSSRGIFLPSKVAFNSGSSSKTASATTGSPLVIKDYDKECPNKLDVEEKRMPLKVEVADSEGDDKIIEDVFTKEKSNTVTKIKWCNLEDKAFLLNNHSQSSLTFAKAEDANIPHGNLQDHGHSENLSESSTHLLSCYQANVVQESATNAVQESAAIAVEESAANAAQESTSTTWKEVEQFPIEDIKVVNIHLTNADRSLNDNYDGVAESRVSSNLISESIHKGFYPAPASPVKGIVQVTLQDSLRNSGDEALSAPECSVTDENIGMTIDLGKEDMHPQLSSNAETSIHSSATITMEDRKGLHNSLNVGPDVAEGEPGESKERFRQRLWCFLFENLNRAVDELYLLCELECDIEQMDEAILVLEEAISDFRDLKHRVGHFENTKRTSSQLKEGMPITVKTDHRRPHALSWEVRRMTTSPQRAEILASSLEAFKKIQLERAGKAMSRVVKRSDFTNSSQKVLSGSTGKNEVSSSSTRKQANSLNANLENTNREKQYMEATRLGKGHLPQNGRMPSQNTPQSVGKSKREHGPIPEIQKQLLKKDKEPAENRAAKYIRSMDMDKKQSSNIDKEKEKQSTVSWKSMDAWKEKRNWEDVLKSPLRTSSRVSYPPSMNRRGTERARVLHDKLMSPEKKKKSALDLKREAEEKHARAMRIRNQLETERLQKLHRTSEKLNRVNEWQAVRSSKLREIMFARHQRSESLHEAYLAQVVRRAGDESSKVNEVRFITSLNEENKKLMLRQKLHDSEMRRAEKLQVMRTKQKEDTAREEAALERRKLLEAEKLQRLVETQRRKEEAQVRREEERKASSAAREAKAVEQLRRKEIRAKAQQEEAELLAQKLAEKLRESEQRRKYYLEQIREKASMDFRDQSSPFQRRPFHKEGQNRSMPANSSEDNSAAYISDSALKIVNATNHQSMKRRIKKIRQRLMALKHEFVEPSSGTENAGVGYRTSMVAAKAKIGRWVQDLQRLRQARKEGAASIGLIVGDVIKFVDGKDLELHASRHAGLLDFVSSALPASHISKPEACQVTVYLLRLLRVLLSLPANRSYFLAQNLLPPIIPMLSASLEKYIKVAASSNSGSTSLLPIKASSENLDSVAEILDGFLWIVSTIVGHAHYDDRQLQMQDGLIELIVAYQVIHHLRDLFALYDRPQVEGSPFPSSILLGLALLSVLTSRPGTISSVDWDFSISKAENTYKAHGLRESIVDSSDITNLSGISKSHSTIQKLVEMDSNESMKLSEEEISLSTEVPLFSITEGRPLEEENKREFSDSDIPSGLRTQIYMSEKQTKSSLVESPKSAFKEQANSALQHKDDKNPINNLVEGNGKYEHITHDNLGSRKQGSSSQPAKFLLTAISDTGLVSLLSLLTAVLLQANNKLSSEQGSYILPSNFEEVATGVLKVLNNLANLDITVLQSLLAKSDLKVEFFHLMSFLLTHCTNQWKTANDQVGLLLLESLLLLGYFSLFHPENQAVLRWGKSPTILHKVCDLPFAFFSDPELMPILAGTLVAACYLCEQNRGVVQQELSTDMLLSLLKSCKQGLLSAQVDSSLPDTSVPSDPGDSHQMVPDGKKSQNELQLRSNRRFTRASLGKGLLCSSTRISRGKAQRDSKGSKTCEDWILKHNLPASEASSTFMLHRRFPSSFLDKAEVFFSAETSTQ